MERIRQLRKAKGLSQAKLAVMADMDPATLNRLEQGKGNPNIRTLERVAGALGVEVADLLGKASAPPSREPSFNDVLEGERRAAAVKRFEENLRHFTNRWREELKNPQKQGQYWCAGVQVTAIGFTELIGKLDLFRRIVEVAQQSPAGLIQEIKKGHNGSAMSDPEFRAAMDLLSAFEDMHKASDEVLEADAAVQGDWIAHEEAEQRRKAFSVIQGEMTA
jgi:transcriptional regulator with XRE-family HTH domain